MPNLTTKICHSFAFNILFYIFQELDILTLAETDGTINERNKRTIGILRELFPQLSQVSMELSHLISN